MLQLAVRTLYGSGISAEQKKSMINDPTEENYCQIKAGKGSVLNEHCCSKAIFSVHLPTFNVGSVVRMYEMQTTSSKKSGRDKRIICYTKKKTIWVRKSFCCRKLTKYCKIKKIWQCQPNSMNEEKRNIFSNSIKHKKKMSEKNPWKIAMTLKTKIIYIFKQLKCERVFYVFP